MTQPEQGHDGGASAQFSNGSKPLSEQLKRRRGRPAMYTEEERADRSKKATKAAALAAGVLKQRHEAEYQELLTQAKSEVGL